MVSWLYSCHLLGDPLGASAHVTLKARDDADAIFACRTIAETLPGCVGYEVSRSERLIYRHEHPRVSATVIDIQPRCSTPWMRAIARRNRPMLVDLSVVAPRLSLPIDGGISFEPRPPHA